MSKKKDIVNLGKQLAFLLRHDQEALERGDIDRNGWRQVSELCDHQGYTREVLEEIVATNEKRRYEYNEDHTKIRARQGHSIKVDVGLREVEPPKFLYHGTSSRVSSLIMREGIKKMSRQHVHLSEDIETARMVAMRHVHDEDWMVIYIIDTEKMLSDGLKFFKSNNGVWLTDYVDPKYIIDCLAQDKM